MSNLFDCFLKSELELFSTPCCCIGGGGTAGGVFILGTVGGSAGGDVILGAGGCGGGPRFVRRLGSLVLPPAAVDVVIVAPAFF